ncbi:putative Nudix hydrolase NudL [Alphaproteobacteria bacterium SO-S41]|nr:putative Nudix hydrolase NudL [Alphaproteobacteria bacterium SO-S41]
MSIPFTEALRADITARCADFPRHVEPVSALKLAAVAIVVVPADDGVEAGFLLTRRAATLRGHAGQWALPGGRCDEGETLEIAALRELGEEVGVRLAPDRILGVLDDYPSRSGYAIAPVIVWGGADLVLRPNPDEVASVHRIPLSLFSQPGAVEFITIPESDRPVIRLHFAERNIHAPTAALIYQFIELLAGRITRVAELEQPVFAWR